MTKQAEMAAEWAAQSGKKQKASSASYEGRSLYSYGTAIAQLHTFGGTRVALFTSNRYSKSTSTTWGIAYDAANLAGWLNFIVPDITGHLHETNLLYFEERAKNREEKAERARTEGSREQYLAAARNLRKIAESYRSLVSL